LSEKAIFSLTLRGAVLWFMPITTICIKSNISLWQRFFVH
jgi:hypothetical protein